MVTNPPPLPLQDEQERIEAAGGMVVWMGAWRVNGSLSVSRAIGDVKLKKWVVGDADVEVQTMEGTEDYLVVACDGVWDVLDGQEVVKCVDSHLANGSSKHSVAQAIIECAKSEGAGDNMTVIVIFFNGFGSTLRLQSSGDDPNKDCSRHSNSSPTPCTS